MPDQTPFRQSRLDCLLEQFKAVARGGDPTRIDGMRRVLRAEGLDDERITALYIQFTMRDMPDDFVPQADIIAMARQDRAAHAADCTCSRCGG
ncbi:MAG: hypothetical protein GYB64_04085 [Chloroflexi bacterium]|nr:hypothetical protein [Chloroflexota bacterium]